MRAYAVGAPGRDKLIKFLMSPTVWVWLNFETSRVPSDSRIWEMRSGFYNYVGEYLVGY